MDRAAPPAEGTSVREQTRLHFHHHCHYGHGLWWFCLLHLQSWSGVYGGENHVCAGASEMSCFGMVFLLHQSASLVTGCSDGFQHGKVDGE